MLVVKLLLKESIPEVEEDREEVVKVPAVRMNCSIVAFGEVTRFIHVFIFTLHKLRKPFIAILFFENVNDIVLHSNYKAFKHCRNLSSIRRVH